MLSFFTTAFFPSPAARRPARWLLALLWLVAQRGHAQVPAWQSALLLSQGSGNYSSVLGTAADASGNVFVVGSFTGTVRFGTTSLTSVGGTADGFVAKWSSTQGGFVWAQQAGGNDTDEAKAVAVSGNVIYFTGSYHSDVLAVGALALPNVGASLSTRDTFVAKIVDDGLTGRLVWAQRAGGTGEDFATALAVSGANVYAGGSFASGVATFGSSAVVPAGAGPVVVAKLIDAGSTSSFGWVQRAGGALYDSPAALAVSGSNVYVAGNFSGGASAFGSIIITNNAGSYSTSNAYDMFVAKLVDTGPGSSYVWAYRAGGIFNDLATALAVSGTSVYVAGRFESASISLGSFTLVNSSAALYGADGFVAKLTDAGSSGTFAWVQPIGGPGSETPRALALHGASLYIAGSFVGPTATFGSSTATGAVGNGPYSADGFVAKLTDAGTAGSFGWVQPAGGAGSDLSYAVCTTGTSIVVGGVVVPPAAFGGITLSATLANESGFLATLADATLAATTAAGPLAGSTVYPNPVHATATVQLPALPGVA
ncbi:autotransporter outer membrane beta-barrel domain-containing protein, partial [Hymenobacter agri]